MNRFLSLIVCMHISLCLLAQTKIGNLSYELNEEDKTATVVEDELEFYSGHITIPEKVEFEGEQYTVTSIDEFAMYDCGGLVKIDLPQTITSIGQYAFENCASLTSVQLPSQLQSLGAHAFGQCTGLASIKLPGTLKDIGEGVFENCTELTTIELEEGIPYISSSMFSGCEAITSLTLPSSVTDIRDWAFANCLSVQTITFSEGLEKIGECAFAFCVKVQSLHLPEGLDAIADKAFANCDNLAVVQLPSTLTAVGDAIFDTCELLAAIKCLGQTPPIFTTQTQLIDFYDFTILYVPTGTKEKYRSADVWSSFKEIRECEDQQEIEDRLFKTEEGELKFLVCPFLQQAKVVKRGAELYYEGTPVIPETITYEGKPYTVTCIGNGAFERCFQVDAVVIPNTVLYIGDWAFAGCQYIQKFTLPNRLQAIGKDAFFGCALLKEITLPNSLKKIGDEAFQACVSLKKVFSYIQEPFDIPERTFDFNYEENNLTLYVPIGTTQKYKEKAVWRLFPNILESEFLHVEDIIADAPANQLLYTIDGRQTSYKGPGIYIQNGRKILLP